jgi:hypothetical protein
MLHHSYRGRCRALVRTVGTGDVTFRQTVVRAASCRRRRAVVVSNKPVPRASTGLITFGRGPVARVALVSVSELSPCLVRGAIEQLAPVHASWVYVYSLPRTLRGGAVWSLLRSVGSCKHVLRVGARRGGGRRLRIERQSGAA